MLQEPAPKNILEILGNLENCPDETLAPYQEFERGGQIYYFTPGESLYRKDLGSEEVGGFFCGYLSNEAWCYRTDAA